MLNLIQPEQKKKIIREYRMRFWVVSLVIFFGLEIISIALLIPSYIISIAQVQSLQLEEKSIQSNSTLAQSASSTALLTAATTQMAILAGNSIPVNAAKTILDLLSNTSSAIKINGLVYATQNGGRQIIIQGTAATREDLVAFSNYIKGQPNVSKIDLPISNFTQAKNINFSMAVTIS